MLDPEARLHHGLLASSLSLGLATAARLVYPPLSYAGAVMLVYMGVPAAQATFEDLQAGRTVNRHLVETLALTVLLAQGQILVGSAAFSLYYAWGYLRWQHTQRRQALAQLVRVQQGDQVVDCPLSDVQPGMHLLFSSGDLIPLTGVVVEGQALVNRHVFTPQAKETILQIGDCLPAGSLILVGQLCVQATQPEVGCAGQNAVNKFRERIKQMQGLPFALKQCPKNGFSVNNPLNPFPESANSATM